MLLKYSAILLLFLSVKDSLCAKSKSKCSISKWVHLEMAELLTLSQVVVFGRETNNITLFQSVYSSFEVLCVLKSDNSDVHENITIFSVSPVSKCSGTAGTYEQGDLIILGLRRISNYTFQWDEHVPITSVAFPATFDNFLEISSTCEIQSWTKPIGAFVNRCPICSNDDMFQNHSVPMNATCFSDTLNYNNCAKIQRVPIETTCECTDSTVSVGDNGTVKLGMTVILLLISVIVVFMELG